MILALLGIVLTVVWIVSLARYDSKDEGCIPNEKECSLCPFPCDKRKNLKGDSTNYENQ